MASPSDVPLFLLVPWIIAKRARDFNGNFAGTADGRRCTPMTAENHKT